MKQMKTLLVVLGVGIMLLFSTQAFATQVFYDGFEGDLSAWTGNDSHTLGSPSGVILTDPLGSSTNVLHFTSLGSGGDIYTKDSFSSSTGQYILSFDYYGVGANSGGYIGYSNGTPGATNAWLAGADDSYAPNHGLTILKPDETWASYTFAFSVADKTQPIQIMVEDFIGSGSVAGDAYFDNIKLNTAPVPEPATMLLLGFGLLGLVGFRKKLIKS